MGNDLQRLERYAANTALAIWRRDEYILSFGSLLNFGFGRRITPGNRIRNELLYL